jgi:1,3-beta-glucan synthase
VLITLYANYSIASLLVCVLVVWLPKSMLARSLVNTAYNRMDSLLGMALAVVLLVICVIGEIGLIMVDKVQTLVQFNDRYVFAHAARQYGGDDDMGGGGKLRRRKVPTEAAPMLTPRGSVTVDCDGRRLSAGCGRQLGEVGGGSRITHAGDASPRRSSPEVLDWFSPRIHTSGRTGTDWNPMIVTASLTFGTDCAAGSSDAAGGAADTSATLLPAGDAAAPQPPTACVPELAPEPVAPAVLLSASAASADRSLAAYQPPAYQPPAYQPPAYQRPALPVDAPPPAVQVLMSADDQPPEPSAAAAAAPTTVLLGLSTQQPSATAAAQEEPVLPVSLPAPEAAVVPPVQVAAAAPPAPQPSAAALEHTASYCQR